MSEALTHYTFFIQLDKEGEFMNAWVEDTFQGGNQGTRRNKQALSEEDIAEIQEELVNIHDSKLGAYFKDLQRADYKLVWLEVDQTDETISAAISRIQDDRERNQMEIWQAEGLVYGRTHPYTTKLLEITGVDVAAFDAAWLQVQDISSG